MNIITVWNRNKVIANLAHKALIVEVSATPKPGLVDRDNNGAHVDMNFFTFIDSSFSMVSYLINCAEAATEIDELNSLFKQLRGFGIIAEKEMFKATNGVNTHKGAIFSLGILTAAVSYNLNKNIKSIYEIPKVCTELCKNIIKEDLDTLKEKKEFLTVGQRLYLEYGITGVRGEAAEGFPSVFNIALPYFIELTDEGVSLNDACVQTLLKLIVNTCDTNIISRAGIEGLKYAKQISNNVLEKGGIKNMKRVEEMDRDFISKNISPGGCADLLCATCFLYFLIKEDILVNN